LRQRDAKVAEARQREQELVAKLNSQEETHLFTRKEWETSLEKTRGSMESLKVQLARTEKEREEAKEFAAEGYSRVQSLEKKLSEASAFLNGLSNGQHSVAGRG
jgi:chromosome segregation ATPase